jgi:hypothetical protein
MIFVFIQTMQCGSFVHVHTFLNNEVGGFLSELTFNSINTVLQNGGCISDCLMVLKFVGMLVCFS